MAHTPIPSPAPAVIDITPYARDRVVIGVRGRLDRAVVARLRTALADARSRGVPHLHLDLSAMTACDQDGGDRGLIRALAWARIQLREHDQSLTLIGAPARLRAELETAGRELDEPAWPGVRPGHPRYRPETADQP